MDFNHHPARFMRSWLVEDPLLQIVSLIINFLEDIRVGFPLPLDGFLLLELSLQKTLGLFSLEHKQSRLSLPFS